MQVITETDEGNRSLFIVLWLRTTNPQVYRDKMAKNAVPSKTSTTVGKIGSYLMEVYHHGRMPSWKYTLMKVYHHGGMSRGGIVSWRYVSWRYVIMGGFLINSINNAKRDIL